MSRRIAIRFMLSLLLLLSQQMAVSHAMSHWAGSAHSQVEEDSRLSAAIAQDQSCDQCLSFAQLAGAVGADHCRWGVQANPRLAIAASPDGGPNLAAIAAFQPRGPPVFA